MTEADREYEAAERKAAAQLDELERTVGRVNEAAIDFSEHWVGEQVAAAYSAYYAKTLDGSMDRIRSLKSARDKLVSSLQGSIEEALAGDRYWRHRSARFLEEAVADEKALLKFDLMREVEEVIREIVSEAGKVLEEGEILDSVGDRAWSREHNGELFYRGGLGSMAAVVDRYNRFVNEIPQYMDALSAYRALLVELQAARRRQLEARARELWDSV